MIALLAPELGTPKQLTDYHVNTAILIRAILRP
jgi:hypothetical protein